MSQDAKKRRVAEAAFDKIRHLLDKNTPIGIGTGSTANCFIDVLAKSKIGILGAVASSKATEDRLRSYGIELLDLNSTGTLCVYIDGADEADSALNLIKGGGAALTREKIIAEASVQFICIADDSKRVDCLGTFPLPVEVIPMARSSTRVGTAHIPSRRARSPVSIVTRASPRVSPVSPAPPPPHSPRRETFAETKIVAVSGVSKDLIIPIGTGAGPCRRRRR